MLYHLHCFLNLEQENSQEGIFPVFFLEFVMWKYKNRYICFY